VQGEYREKNNDLYRFEQTDDLAHVDGSRYPTLARLAGVIRSEAMTRWVASVTGIEDLQAETADLFGASYGDGAHLLCHDDRMPNRRVAYIVYLVPEDWCAEDGGALDLFDSCASPGGDGSAQPRECISASLLPSWNSLALFPVSQRSYHQVAEVLCEDRSRTRLSIGGWFYGPDLGVTRTRKLPPSIVWLPLTKPLDSPRYPGASSEASRVSECATTHKETPAGQSPPMPCSSSDATVGAPATSSSVIGHGPGRTATVAEHQEAQQRQDQHLKQHRGREEKHEDLEHSATDEQADEHAEEESARVAALPQIPELWMDDEGVLPWWLMEAACWVNHSYLNPLVQDQIRATFVDESSVLLQDFLLPGRLRRVCADLQRVRWCSRGPAHKQFYYEMVVHEDEDTAVPSSSSVAARALLSELPMSIEDLCEVDRELGPPGAELQRLQEFLRSEVCAALLGTLTNVQVNAAVSTLRRFTQGCYTLMHDEQPQSTGEASLDVMDACLCLMPAWPTVSCSYAPVEQAGGGDEEREASTSKLSVETSGNDRSVADEEDGVEGVTAFVNAQEEGEWQLQWGGWQAYVADDEELITVLPEHNCLSLVYRVADSGVQQFVKYVNHHAPCHRYDIQLHYRAVPGEEGSDDDEELDEIADEELEASAGGV